MTPSTPDDTHSGMVISRAKSYVSTSSSFGGVKTDRHTDRIALYGIDLAYKNLSQYLSNIENND